MIHEQLFYPPAVFLSRLNAFFSKTNHLHNARFAYLHERDHLLSPAFETLGTSLLLGTSAWNHIAAVRPTKERAELGNLLICAPPRSGKSMLAISQLLTWPHSAIVNDMPKGELFVKTAGYRATLGPVYVINPVAGVGHRYDPFTGRYSERALGTLAHHLLFDPQDHDPIFFKRAKKMLTQMCRAARVENAREGKERSRILPYVGNLLTTKGFQGTAEYLQHLDPELATKFLAEEFAKAAFDDRFLLSCWGTLDTLLWPLLTDDVIRCFTGSDFTISDFMTGKRPATVYVQLPESELRALAPFVRLLFGSFIDGLTATYDESAKNGTQEACRPVLILADEAGRSAIPQLADAAQTALGRSIYLWIAVQSLSSLEVVYGRGLAQILKDSVETQLYFRPDDLPTAEHLERRFGRHSRFATSQTRYAGKEGSEGLSEQGIPIMTAQEIMRASARTVFALHRDNWPMILSRLEYYRDPLLARRAAIPPPTLPLLPELEQAWGSDPQNGGNHHATTTTTLWQSNRKLPNGYVDPDKRY
jgi:type IV secretion system protein VirD4